MPNLLSPFQIERLKRDAKQYSRAYSLTHSEALDRLARSNGYHNWSLLMKKCQLADDTQSIAASGELRTPFVFSRTLDEMMQSVRKIPEPRYGFPNRIEEARQQVEDISHNFISAENAVDFSVGYMTMLLEVPRYKIYDSAKANWEMRCWLPYCVHPFKKGGDHQAQILVNRRYKPVGQISDDFVEYDSFPHLHAGLDIKQILAFSHRSNSPGYLFSDGYAPWHTRKDAEIYLQRLHVLQAAIKEKS